MIFWFKCNCGSKFNFKLDPQAVVKELALREKLEIGVFSARPLTCFHCWNKQPPNQFEMEDRPQIDQSVPGNIWLRMN